MEKLWIVEIDTEEKDAIVLVRAETELEACCNAYFMLLIDTDDGCSSPGWGNLYPFSSISVRARPAEPGILDYGKWD